MDDFLGLLPDKHLAKLFDELTDEIPVVLSDEYSEELHGDFFDDFPDELLAKLSEELFDVFSDVLPVELFGKFCGVFFEDSPDEWPGELSNELEEDTFLLLFELNGSDCLSISFVDELVKGFELASVTLEGGRVGFPDEILVPFDWGDGVPTLIVEKPNEDTEEISLELRAADVSWPIVGLKGIVVERPCVELKEDGIVCGVVWWMSYAERFVQSFEFNDVDLPSKDFAKDFLEKDNKLDSELADNNGEDVVRLLFGHW